MGALYSKAVQQSAKSNASEYVQTDLTICTDVDDSSIVYGLRGAGAGRDIISTPRAQLIRTSLVDPRSATIGIVRTPIIVVTPADSDGGCQTPKAAPLTVGLYSAGGAEADVGELETPAEGRDRPEQAHSLEGVGEVPKPDQDSTEANELEVVLTPAKTDEARSPFLLKLQAEEELPPSSDEGDADVEEESGGGDGEKWRCHEDVLLAGHGVTRRELDALKKKLFVTPEPVAVKHVLGVTPETIKPKGGRTPLGMVCHNRDHGGVVSPTAALAKRPWRGFAEERRRLGLENTPPPALPPPDAPQSAPGGRLQQRHHPSRARWDPTDTSVLI